MTPVIFRKNVPSAFDLDDAVFALFPAEPADYEGRLCTCYHRVGQHGGANYDHCIATSRPAEPEEYADLLEELRGKYDDLVVFRRRNRAHRAEFKKTLRELR